MGIVSAVGRSNVGIADYEDFIQTDAAINPGNSGGALVNTSGQLVGINTAIFSTSGGYMGIGFAIPMDMAKTVMDSIIKTGKVIRGWLGVSIQNITPDLAKSLGIKDTTGALVSGVMKNSPAEKAGIKRGDIITELDGKTVEDSRMLRNMVADNAPGKTVTVTVMRKDKKELLKVTLGEFQDTKVAKKADFDFDNLLKDVVVQDLTPDLRERLNIPADITGVVVSQIDPASERAAAGRRDHGSGAQACCERKGVQRDRIENRAQGRRADAHLPRWGIHIYYVETVKRDQGSGVRGRGQVWTLVFHADSDFSHLLLTPDS